MKAAGMDPIPAPTYRLDRPARDPRTDLRADSVLWDWVLGHQGAIDGGHPLGLYGVLHGLRCYGAHLSPRDDDRPGLILSAGELTADEYASFRSDYLVPHQGALSALLRLTPPPSVVSLWHTINDDDRTYYSDVGD